MIQATHRGTGRKFACKVVNITRMEPRQVSKLYSEVSVLRELDHPHIVRMREVFYSKVRRLPCALPCALPPSGSCVSWGFPSSRAYLRGTRGCVPVLGSARQGLLPSFEDRWGLISLPHLLRPVRWRAEPS